ncbi:PREDICTED: uncharacterized protein LOC103344035 isoform X1 [Prunus mume]|uniref:Uncharacterized protein LOC103344035 isoform X1 n=1 Tax=Prunus mume TaxID=102107 RepID=A0ABM0PX02_PRUMU|nr:PREDICTED: uncharacterized protein LOC103344035 isoform X1 [Prunus mume]XP_016652720.1 PREDICTED: uncharacterized protein LOC103344035 isoform X1 [Prunus mume]
MEGRFADELYSESLQLSKLQLDPTSNANSEQSNLRDLDRVELCHGDGSCDGFSDELDDTSEVMGEWMKIEEKTRYNQHHTVGYREGVIAGKEASSQEGFNIGFKQSVLVGYNWGLVRGVTSALANLPDGLREKLIGTEDQITGLQGLYESVHSLSTTDALRLFNDEIMDKKAREQSENADTSSLEAGLPEQIPDRSGLRNHYAELRSLLFESPAIKVHLDR